MSKASAEKLAAAGFKYIGRSYQEMDCQTFFEKCLQDAGITEDLKGSNAWYRKIRKEGISWQIRNRLRTNLRIKQWPGI